MKNKTKKENIGVKKIYDTIVIGAGPAGVNTACYAKRKGLDTLIITKDFGGQINYTSKIFSNISAGHGINSKKLIENYRKGIKHEDVSIVYDEVLDIKQKEDTNFIIKGKKNNYKSKTIILTTGRKPKEVELPFDKSVKNKKICYFTDYPYHSLHKSKNILIVGGGYVGLDVAEELSHTAKTISIVEKTNHLGGNKRRQDKVKSASNIKIYMNSEVVNIYSKAEKIYALINHEGVAKEILIDGIFSSIGTVPVTNFIKRLVKTGDGIIKTGYRGKSKFMSSKNGIFACGDCAVPGYKGFEPVAAGNAVECAYDVYSFLFKLKH
ncbi:MAG: NAD(P)/FAD-dependent oxidoreductase [Candidatus Moranbacteria bacterium]|nr:NAD(P)/FAD-dependent oxidoreductase [Candidatus Moranbacteria bacterium]